MQVKCIEMSTKFGDSIIVRGFKKNEKGDSLGPGCNFMNLGCGKGLFSYSAELLLFVQIGENVISISVDKQFRKKFEKPGTSHAKLTEDQIKRIGRAMPDGIEVKKGDGCYAYEVPDQEIDTWFARL